jgi:stage V sporulation protein G
MNKQGVDDMKSTMNVTEIKVYPYKNGDGKFKGFAHIVLNGTLRLNGLKVLEGDNGLFVGYPSEKGKDGQFYDIVHPITRETRNVIQDAVLANYEKAVAA